MIDLAKEKWVVTTALLLSEGGNSGIRDKWLYLVSIMKMEQMQ